MVKHVVVFKLKDFNDSDRLREAILGMEGKIPGLLSIEAGVDFNRSDAAGDLVLISTHRDKEALKIYQNHPEHIKVKDQIVPCAAGRTVVDFSL